MFSTLNLFVLHILIYSNTYFLCLIFSISLRPWQERHESWVLHYKGPLWDHPLCSGGGIHRAKGMWIYVAHISFYFFFCEYLEKDTFQHTFQVPRTMGFPFQMISNPFPGLMQTFSKSIWSNAHSATSVCIIISKGLTSCSFLQRVGQRLDMSFGVTHICVRSQLLHNRAKSRDNRRCFGQRSGV